jgi:hypothetical protein
MPVAKLIMIFHCRRHLYFPLLPSANLQNQHPHRLIFSYKSLSQISTIFTADENTTSLAILQNH